MDFEAEFQRAKGSRPRKYGLTDERLTELIRLIFNVRLSEEAVNYWLEVLKIETGIADVSDYIFWAETDEETAVIQSIFRDRGNKTIYL